MRVIRPQGNAVVAALRRYDPNLDVRWSWERKKWAIVVRPLRPELIPAPVKWEKTDVGWHEVKLPEKSEAAVSYRTETMPVAYVDKISWTVLGDIIDNDTWRKGRIQKQLKAMNEKVEADRKKVEADRRREAFKFMKWHASTHPMAEG